MLKLLYKIITTPRTVIPRKTFTAEPIELQTVGLALEQKIKKLFNGSLAIRQVDAGSDNACEQELVALSNSFYDAERFGIHFVASPRHADMLLVTGPVTRNMKTALESAYNAMPSPKLVVSIGDDALDGGIFKNSYAIVGGVSDVIPVNYHIPGDPPNPLTILRHLLTILSSPVPSQSHT